MFDGACGRERLDPPRFGLPRPRRATLFRWAAATALLVLAGLVLLAGSPAPPVVTGCRDPVLRPRRPVPPAGMVGVPVSLAAGAAGVVRAGDRIDVLATAADRLPVLLAADVLVLSVQTAGDGAGDGATLYIAARPDPAQRLAGVAPDARFAITVRPP